MSKKELNFVQKVDQLEESWQQEANEKLKPLMDFLSGKLGYDLYGKHGKRSSLELWQYTKFWLFATQKDLLYDALSECGFDIAKFEYEMLASLILSVTRERENASVVLKTMTVNGIVKELRESDGKFILDTRFGEMTFRKADAYFDYQNETVGRILQKDDLVGGCHEVTEMFWQSAPQTKVMTTVCCKNLLEKYWHSVNLLTDGKVMDLTANLVVDKDDFDILYNVRESLVMSMEVFQELKSEADELDENNILWPLLRVAAHERMKYGRL